MPSVFEPSAHPSEHSTYRSTNTGFIAALLTADLADYVGAEFVENSSNVVFIVTDAAARGPELELQFQRGVFPRVHPKLFLEARAYLQSEVARLQKEESGRRRRGGNDDSPRR